MLQPTPNDIDNRDDFGGPTMRLPKMKKRQNYDTYIYNIEM